MQLLFSSPDVLQPFQSTLTFPPSQGSVRCFAAQPIDNNNVEDEYSVILTLQTSVPRVQLLPIRTVLDIADDDSESHLE